MPVVDVPSPTDGHGWTLDSGHLEPLWVDGPIIPEVLADEVDQLLMQMTLMMNFPTMTQMPMHHCMFHQRVKTAPHRPPPPKPEYL